MLHVGTTIRPGENINFSLDDKGEMYINAAAGGGDVEFNISGTKLQWRYSGDTAWIDLFDIPQPSLVFSPHLWPVNTEINLGDGSYGMRFTGVIAGSANTVIETGVGSVYAGAKPYGYGGCWYTGTSYVPLMTDHPLASPSWSSRITITPAGAFTLSTKSSSARTNAPYDVWIRYTKD